MTKSRGILAPRVPWTDEQLAVLRARYPHERTEDIAPALGRAVSQVYQKAAHLGLKKSAEYLASPAACRLRRGDNVGAAHRFQKGGAAWNKDMKGLHIGGEATQFQPGQMPTNWKPIGSERVSDGYLQRKMTDTGYPPRDWVGVHILVWQEHNGPIPEKHIVVFKDGNKTNIVIDNLECISRADLMRRNTVHNLPKEISELVHMRAVLARQINKRSKNERAKEND